MMRLKRIKFSDEKYNPFLTKFNESTTWGQISMNDDEFIHGYYKNTIHFVIQKHRKSYDLIIQENDAHLLIKDLKTAIKSKEKVDCEIFYPKGKSERKQKTIDSAMEFFNYVFGKEPKLNPKVYEFMRPAKYEDDKTIQRYNYSKPPPTVSIMEQGEGQYDPAYVSNLNYNVVYVFHVHKPHVYNMKEYVPLGVTVVLREKKNVNYKYTNILRITYPSWGVFFSDDEVDLSLYIRELRNIIISVPFLGKFRGLSPYPRIITECKVAHDRIGIRSCT